MKKSKEELIKSMYENVKEDDFKSELYNIVDELNKFEDLSDTIEPIIKLMELNSEIDFGNPGPLVHYLESLNEIEYAKKLIESVKRNPTEQTVFMLNRILNLETVDALKANLQYSETIIIDDLLVNCDKAYSYQNQNKERVDIVLTKQLDTKKDLIKIKKVLNIDKSIKELIDLTNTVPAVLLKSVAIGRAKNIIKEFGEIGEKIELV